MTSSLALPASDLPVGRLRHHAAATPEAVVYRFLEQGSEVGSLTYAQLGDRVERLAGALARETTGGDRVGLVFAPGIDFMVAFWACLTAGRIAVPVYPPTDRGAAARTAAVFDDAGVTLVLTTAAVRARLRPLRWTVRRLGQRSWFSVDGHHPAVEEALPTPSADDVAMLQYTSGSTGDPKGVMVTHGNLATNVSAIATALALVEPIVIVGWLPPYHDMGLIGNVVLAASLGCEYIGMAPWDFLADPHHFLEAMSHYGGSASAMPNFGFELCVRKTTRAQRAELDLRSWRIALNGAEPVRAATVRRFSHAFAASGFDASAVRPTYGLAEATLAVTMATAAGMQVSAVDPHALDRGAVRPAGTTGATGRELVSTGGAVPGARVRVVDPETRQPVPDGGVGEIWVAGPVVAKGYWGRPELTEHTFRAMVAGADPVVGEGYLRTGDLGAVVDGQLYVTGRLKDVIIIRGRNLYPHDVERAVEAIGSPVRPGCVAAVGVDRADGEGLVVVAEVRDLVSAGQTCGAVRDAVAAECGVTPRSVLLVLPGTLPKTTSGKLRRHAVAAAVTDGTLTPVRGGRWDALEDDTVAPTADGDGTATVEELFAELEHLVRQPASAPSTAGAERLSELGLDSIRTVELAHRVQGRFRVVLPTELLAGDPTLAELVAAIHAAQLRSEPDPVEPDDPTRLVDELDDDEVIRMLAALEGRAGR